MCGRLNVTSDPLCKAVSSALGVAFSTPDNHDLCPSQEVACIANSGNELSQLNATWGIKPSWSKKLLINAQAETVDSKPTFRKAFQNRRCVIPCSGWYEWCSNNGSGKRKYLFELEEEQTIYMAGIWFEPTDREGLPQLVTLTTEPTPECASYHHRMPLVLPDGAVRDWVQSNNLNCVSEIMMLGRPHVNIFDA